ncbi:sulfotransferase family protein [Altibacter lentus]|uniref:sulfotransferase family protein n=1 Tax=Altibacter lentus TaxID=1223410 RepID=UPI000554C994|nr:sulfotransferase [Altibacter lentus]
MGNKANLFIVGAMKAGTTSFIETLSTHPEIYVSPVKEPHYFVNELPAALYQDSRFFDLQRYLDHQFPEPLHITKIKTEAQYARLFSLARSETYRAEGSTAYLHAPETAGLIKEYNARAGILIILRDPFKRAFSHYKMNLSLGKEKRSFEKVMLSDLEKYDQGTLQWHSYLGMSCYDRAVRRFEQHFDRIHIIRFEDLMKHPQKVFSSLESFLGIIPFTPVTTEHKNESKALRFQKLFYILKQLGLKDYFSRIFSATFRQWLFRKVTKNKKQEMVLTETTRKRVEEVFKKESQRWSS